MSMTPPPPSMQESTGRRKVVQIAVVDNDAVSAVYALCNDGTIWVSITQLGDETKVWTPGKLPPGC